MNLVILIGHVGQDPETRIIKDDIQVSTFSLATSKYWKDKNGERQTETQWHNIVAWKGLSKLCSYIKKGSKISITGELKYEKYEKDGGFKYVTKIIASGIELLDKKSDSQTKVNQVTENEIPENIDNQSDDLPF